MFVVFLGSKHLLQTNQSILFLGKIFLILCHEFTSGYDGVSNGLNELLQTCKQWVYFCEHEQ